MGNPSVQRNVRSLLGVAVNTYGKRFIPTLRFVRHKSLLFSGFVTTQRRPLVCSSLLACDGQMSLIVAPGLGPALP